MTTPKLTLCEPSTRKVGVHGLPLKNPNVQQMVDAIRTISLTIPIGSSVMVCHGNKEDVQDGDLSLFSFGAKFDSLVAQEFARANLQRALDCPVEVDPSMPTDEGPFLVLLRFVEVN